MFVLSFFDNRCEASILCFFVVVVEVRRIKRDTEMSCAISSEAKRVEGAREGAERGRGSRGPWGQAEPGPLERTLKVNCS